MIVFHAHAQATFAQAGFQALANVGLAGVADGVALFIQQNAVAPAQSGQRADHLQRLRQRGELQAALAQAGQGGARQAFGEAVQALGQQGQLTPGMAAGQAMFQAQQAFPRLLQTALQGLMQAPLQIVHTQRQLLHPLARMAQAAQGTAAPDQNGSLAGSPSGSRPAAHRYRLPVEM